MHGLDRASCAQPNYQHEQICKTTITNPSSLSLVLAAANIQTCKHAHPLPFANTHATKRFKPQAEILFEEMCAETAKDLGLQTLQELGYCGEDSDQAN